MVAEAQAVFWSASADACNAVVASPLPHRERRLEPNAFGRMVTVDGMVRLEAAR